jgi:hypothetical protein
VNDVAGDQKPTAATLRDTESVAIVRGNASFRQRRPQSREQICADFCPFSYGAALGAILAVCRVLAKAKVP